MLSDLNILVNILENHFALSRGTFKRDSCDTEVSPRWPHSSVGCGNGLAPSRRETVYRKMMIKINDANISRQWQPLAGFMQRYF